MLQAGSRERGTGGAKVFGPGPGSQRLLTAGAMPKRVRPPDKQEVTICMGLRRNLREHWLLPWVKEMVDNVSRRTHRAALLVNHYVLRHVEEAGFDGLAQCLTDQVFFYTALSLGKGKKYDRLIQFFSDHELLYESVPELPFGGSRVINSAARQMKTNVCNYLWMTFDTRLRRLCCRQDKLAQNFIIARARNWEPHHQLALNENESHLLDLCQRTLATDDNVSDAWILANPGPVLRMYHNLLRLCEEREVKAFPMLPIFKMKCHFITIDATLLKELLVREGLLSKDLDNDTFNDLQEDFFKSVFKLRGTWTLGNEVKTDGLSLRVNVWRTRTDPLPQCGSKRRAGDPELATPSTDLLLPGDEDDYFSNDPGQANQAFVHHTVSGTVVKKARLTYRQFCLESHHAAHLKKQKRWLQEVQEDLTLLSMTPVRTSSADIFEEYLGSKVAMYERLWQNGMHPRAARARWDYLINSKSCIDRFWSGLAYDHPAGLPLHQRPLLKYGSARWGHGGAPNKRMLASAKQFFRVVLVPEFRTTVCCATCGSRMRAVTQPFVGPMMAGQTRYHRTIRGLKQCCSIVCRHNPLKSRDGNAADNIGNAFPIRPEYLCRQAS